MASLSTSSYRADYYPFEGSALRKCPVDIFSTEPVGAEGMPNRQTTDGDYRYAYQGQEKDKETNKEAFELRLWDSRIGRWLTTDPKRQYASPYLGMGNDPINGIDPDGGWKTKLGAFLWKTFNGGGQIVGTSGNWSVAQQGADGFDTFITNGQFRDIGKSPGSGSISPLLGATPSINDMKGSGLFQGVSISLEFASPFKLPGDNGYGAGIEIGFIDLENTNSNSNIEWILTGKKATEPSFAMGININYLTVENRTNTPLNSSRLDGQGTEFSSSIILLGYSINSDAIDSQSKENTYNIHSVSIGLGIDLSLSKWTTDTHVLTNNK